MDWHFVFSDVHPFLFPTLTGSHYQLHLGMTRCYVAVNTLVHEGIVVSHSLTERSRIIRLSFSIGENIDKNGHQYI